MLYLFMACLGLTLYTYFVYPGILMLLTIGREERGHDLPDPPPRLSLIISAHNEKSTITRKLDNSLSLEYPPDRLQIIVVSDGSQDGTPDIVRGYADRGVQLVEIPEHVGKTMAQNRAVRAADGELLVFSDANAIYHPQALIELAACFDDGQVGCVCGELRYSDVNSPVGKSESLYWRYEQFCKRHESLLGSLLGVNGAIYAVRRECFVELPADIISDFILPMKIYRAGYRVKYCADAVAIENPSQTFGHEFIRKRRIIVRSLHGLSRNLGCLDPVSSGILAFEIWSHKLIRWFVPFWLIGMFAANLMLLDSPVFVAMMSVQAVFYILAVLGGMGGTSLRSVWFVYVPYYFTVINIAAFRAVIEFIMGERYMTWSTVRS